MSSKREFVYYKVVEDDDGHRAVYRIDQKGRNYWIINDKGYEHLMHVSADSIDQEIWIVFHVRVVETVMPWQGYPSLD